LSAAGESDPAAITTRLLELSRKFVTRTHGDVTLMRDGLAQIEAGDPAALAQIHQLAHRACGTGGTLGLCAVSDAAAALERLVEACPADALPDAAVRAEIASRIDALAAELDLLQ
jgi:chemotaxis protein histidine kinase CheA